VAERVPAVMERVPAVAEAGVRGAVATVATAESAAVMAAAGEGAAAMVVAGEDEVMEAAAAIARPRAGPWPTRFAAPGWSAAPATLRPAALPQLVPQPLHRPGPLPDHRLVRAGQDLDALRVRAVADRRAQLAGVGADHVGQRVRVAGVALGPGHAVPLAEPGGLQRVHREHQVPGGDQCRHPRAAVGLDPDDHLRLVQVLA
jgi:hypothetical protein